MDKGKQTGVAGIGIESRAGTLGAARRWRCAGAPFALRELAIEYRLLHALSLDAGGVTSHEDLMRRVWGPGKGNPQAVRSAVRKLRRKLGDDARNLKYIIGERGLGHGMPGVGDG